MTDAALTGPATIDPPRVSPLYDPKVRAIAYQVILCAVIVYVGWSAVRNATENLARAKIATGFGFWNNTAGFDISQRLIDYTQLSTYGQAFWVGLLNTLLVAGIGVVLATVLGFLIGIGRLSRNYVVSKLCGFYVEILRNLPLLLLLLFMYNAVLKALPEVRDSLVIPGGIYLNTRGLILPQPVVGAGFGIVVVLVLLGIVGALAFRHWARKRQEATGRQAPVGWTALGLIVGLPLVVFLLLGSPLTFTAAVKNRFNIAGGVQVLPEFVALLVGLVIYTAAFIAEVVRAGILAVSRGQTEAAAALGLRPGPVLNLVVVPQAMRVITPPLTNQYLNLTKNSSLAVAIGYPDLVNVFTGTVLNQTGQALEVVAITMLVYLSISLTTSFFMNLYNRRTALVER